MQRRMTQTKKSGVNPLEETAEVSEDEVHDSTPKDKPELTEKPCAKKRKTGEHRDNKEGAPPQWKRVRGKRGMLKQLVEIPLDLLFEFYASRASYSLVGRYCFWISILTGALGSMPNNHPHNGILQIRQVLALMILSMYTLENIDQLWKDEYENIQDPNAKHEWMNRKLEERYAIEKHARECESWSKGVQGAHGHGKELLVAERKAMSTKATVKVLSDFGNFLNQFMKGTKSQRLLEEHSEFLESHKNILHEIHKNGSISMPMNSVYPTLGELYRITEGNPSLVDYSKSYPAALLVPFPDIALLWRKDIERKLLDLITNACGADHVFEPNTVFDLAMGTCNALLFQTPIHHSRNGLAAYLHDLNRYRLAFGVVLGEVSWNACGHIKFDPEDLKAFIEIVKMCGFDPKVTTAREMDEADPIIECLSCNHIDEGRATMTWAAVRRHQISHDRQGKAMVLKVLDGEEAMKVRVRMKEEQARRLHKDIDHDDMFMCPHCQSEVGPFSNFWKHLKQNHGITKVKDDELVYALDQSRIPSLYRLWPPRDEELEGDLHPEPQLGDLHQESDESGL
ncbi:hypothetical protein BDZ97DRAFT_2060556 [Flammula alnicola]|nr:hypothetical protein BDZ97DRAFT_2060556 [Flammula alnicola]